MLLAVLCLLDLLAVLGILMAMIRRSLVTLISVLLFAGCGKNGINLNRSAILSQANFSMALSCLKQLQVACSVYQMESDGRFATFSDISKRDYLSRQDILLAWDRQSKPVPLNGYLFSEITEDSDGSALDLRKKCGYVAYPASRNPADGVAILILANLETTPAPVDDDSFVSQGEEWSFFVADVRKVALPVRRFPAPGTLGTVWVGMKKRTPQQALQEAQALAAGVKL
jgi:hypothetical protein